MLEKIIDHQLNQQVNCFLLLTSSKSQIICINLPWINILNYSLQILPNIKKKIKLQLIHYRKNQRQQEKNINMKYLDSVVEVYLKKIDYYLDYKQLLIQQKKILWLLIQKKQVKKIIKNLMLIKIKKELHKQKKILLN